MVKFPDEIKIENCLSKNRLPPIFNNCFIFSSTFHNYETSFATDSHLKICAVTSTTYGKGTFVSVTLKTWNNIESQIKDSMINTFFPKKLKLFFFETNSYKICKNSLKFMHFDCLTQPNFSLRENKKIILLIKKENNSSSLFFISVL